MKATLRKKKLKGGRLRLYLDFYPAVIHPDSGEPTRREFLKLFLYERPKTELEREHNRETRILAENISQRLKEWMSNAGIGRHITFHAFRHTFATLQITFGTDIYTLKDLLSQKNVQTTQIYARVLDEKKKAAVGRIPKIDLD